MGDRAVRWLVIVAALVVFVLLKGRVGLPVAGVLTIALLLGSPFALQRLGRLGRGRGRR